MKYILAVLGVIILIVVAIVLLASTGNRSGDVQEGERQVNLEQLADSDVVVSWTEQGELVGVDEHREIRVIISRNERRVEILEGYDQTVASSKSSANTQEAFTRFMHALSHAGFSRERESEIQDYRGVCPLGKRYIYTLSEGGANKLFLWSTSCRGEDGTFGGSENTVRKLFQNQITDYREFIRGTRL